MIPTFPIKKRATNKFALDLVKEYGEQTVRDFRRQNKQGTRATRQRYENAAWSSVYVAEACGYIVEKEQDAFLKAIVDWACKAKLPKSFF